MFHVLKDNLQAIGIWFKNQEEAKIFSDTITEIIKYKEADNEGDILQTTPMPPASPKTIIPDPQPQPPYHPVNNPVKLPSALAPPPPPPPPPPPFNLHEHPPKIPPPPTQPSASKDHKPPTSKTKPYTGNALNDAIIARLQQINLYKRNSSVYDFPGIENDQDCLTREEEEEEEEK